MAAISTTLATSFVACFKDGTPVAESEEMAPEKLEALLADGDPTKLPAGAMAPPPVSTAPPRFCDQGGGSGGFSGSGSGGFFGDGGVSMAGSGGFVGPAGGSPGKAGASGMGSGTGGFVGSAGAGVRSGPGGAIAMGSGGFFGSGSGGFFGAGSGGFFGAGSGGFFGAGSGGFFGAGSGGFDGAGSGGFGGGGGGNVGDCSRTALAMWTLDDCNTFTTELQESSFSFPTQHRAFRSVAATCVTGVDSGQAVHLATDDDIVYTPDQVDYVFDGGLTVAAWVNAEKLKDTQTIARKRLNGSSSFVLALDDNKLTLAIQLSNGKSIGVTTPFKFKNTWTHVAATYDGKEALLYVNGQVAARSKQKGTIAVGVGPILFGNDASNRRFNGAIDNLWLNTLAAPADLILALTCIRHDATVALTPAMTPATAPGTTVNFDLAITNQNSPACPAAQFSPFFSNLPVGLQASFNLPLSGPIVSGATGHIQVPVASSEDADPGPLTFQMQVFDASGGFFPTSTASATYVVAPLTGCHVLSTREVFVTDVSVVDDPIRTNAAGSASDPRTGAWTFARLMERLSPQTTDAPTMAENIFTSFESPQTVNTFTIQPRPGMQGFLSQWPRTANGKLDLAQAPLRLAAIVNRIDLREPTAVHAGEGRFVFTMTINGNPIQGTLIMEYRLPAANAADIQKWADAWHALGSHPFPSEEYNVALQALTDKITGRGAVPGAPNGSGLLRLRTNEIDLGGGQPWQFREFNFNATGFLAPATVKVTPDQSLNGSALLSQFMTANAAIILTDKQSLPDTFMGKPFQAATVFNDAFTPWFSDGSVDGEVRHHLSLQTCNGCHGIETQTAFTHVFPRFAGSPAALSGFMTGETVQDPISGVTRTFGEIPHRRSDLTTMVCK